MADGSQPKLTGGQVNYYLVHVTHPNREDQVPYRAECEDITHALRLTPEEFCEFKGIWRTGAARQGNGKPGRSQLEQALYDAEKGVHYAKLRVKQARLALEESQRDSKTIAEAMIKAQDKGFVLSSRMVSYLEQQAKDATSEVIGSTQDHLGTPAEQERKRQLAEQQSLRARRTVRSQDLGF